MFPHMKKELYWVNVSSLFIRCLGTHSIILLTQPGSLHVSSSVSINMHSLQYCKESVMAERLVISVTISTAFSNVLTGNIWAVDVSSKCNDFMHKRYPSSVTRFVFTSLFICSTQFLEIYKMVQKRRRIREEIQSDYMNRERRQIGNISLLPCPCAQFFQLLVTYKWSACETQVLLCLPWYRNYS